MTPDEFREMSLQHAEVGKQTMEAIFGAGMEFAPQLLIMPKDKNQRGIVCTLAGLSAGELKDGLISILNSPDVPEPRLIVLTSDTYSMVTKLSDDAPIEEARALAAKYAGRLGYYFAQGDPRVVEAMTVVTITEEYTGHIVQRYRKTATDGIEWDEPEFNEGAEGWSYNEVVHGTSKFNSPKKYPICPHCGNYIPNNERPGEYPGALSRRDNKTEICSDCGRREGMEDLFRYMDSREGDK